MVLEGFKYNTDIPAPPLADESVLSINPLFTNLVIRANIKRKAGAKKACLISISQPLTGILLKIRRYHSKKGDRREYQHQPENHYADNKHYAPANKMKAAMTFNTEARRMIIIS